MLFTDYWSDLNGNKATTADREISRVVHRYQASSKSARRVLQVCYKCASYMAYASSTYKQDITDSEFNLV